MSLLEDLEQAANIELSSVENAALHRLQSSPDFAVFIDIMTRWNMKRAFDLLRDPHADQATTLVEHQGGFQLLKKMIKYVDEAPSPAKKRNDD